MSTKPVSMGLDYSQIIYCANIRDARSNFFSEGRCRLVTLSEFPHLHQLGHSMSALCPISCLLSEQGLKIPKSDLFYELKPVSVYRCTAAVISPSLDWNLTKPCLG